MRINQKVCFISGAGHSGSTLLGFILGSHSHSFYAGEARKSLYLQNKEYPENKRVCKICGANCPVWGDFAIYDPLDLYERLSRKTGKPVIVDSTKNIAWLNSQIDTLTQISAECSLIFLQRDGRAVLNSRIRKYPTIAVQTLIQDWLDQIAATEQLFANFGGPKIKIHYEELATAPATIIQKLCDWLNLPYQEAMLHYYQHDHHPLGGNTGTQLLVIKSQQKPHPYRQLSPKNHYYEHHPLEIRLDLRWQKELAPAALHLFEEMAGLVNEPFRF